MFIKDYSVPIQTKPESVATALAFFEDASPVHGSANYRKVYTDGTHYDLFGQACHVGLTRMGRPEKALDCCALWVNSKGATRYEKWLWEESFAKAFVLARHDRGVVLTSDVPAALLQNIAIMARHVRELANTGNLSFFDYLYPVVGGDIAYILSMNAVSGATSVENRLKVVVRDYGAGHRAWNLFNLDSFCKFVAGDFGKSLDITATPEYTARKVSGLYGGRWYCDYPKPSGSRDFQGYSNQKNIFTTELLQQYPEVKERLSDYRKEIVKAGGYSPPNPFTTVNVATRPSKPEDCTFQEVLDVLLPFMKEKGLIP